MQFFANAGWHVVEVKYGRRCRLRSTSRAATSCAGTSTRCRTRSTSRCSPDAAPSCASGSSPAPTRPTLARSPDVADDELRARSADLGGHDLAELIDCLPSVRRRHRPAERRVRLHGQGMGPARSPATRSTTRRCCPAAQIDDAPTVARARRREPSGTASHPTRRGPDAVRRRRRRAEQRPAAAARPVLHVPVAVGCDRQRRRRVDAGGVRAAAGRGSATIADVGRADRHDVARRQRLDQPRRLDQQGRRVRSRRATPTSSVTTACCEWKQTPTGHHIELGISEMNLFLLLHTLGLGHELHGEHLLPIGTVYDPFVCRGLDALIYGLYNGARFVVAGTPAGRDARPGGRRPPVDDHAVDRARAPRPHVRRAGYAQALDWLLCDGLARLSGPADGKLLYLRLSTRPIDQAPFADVPATTQGRTTCAATSSPAATACASAAPGRRRSCSPRAGRSCPRCSPPPSLLEAEGLPAIVVDLTSPDRLYREWRATLRSAGRGAALAAPTLPPRRACIAPHERRLPIVTVHDAASHTLAWLGSVFGDPVPARRRRRVRPVGLDPRSLRVLRPAPRTDRERGPRGASPDARVGAVRPRRSRGRRPPGVGETASPQHRKARHRCDRWAASNRRRRRRPAARRWRVLRAVEARQPLLHSWSISSVLDHRGVTVEGEVRVVAVVGPPWGG